MAKKINPTASSLEKPSMQSSAHSYREKNAEEKPQISLQKGILFPPPQQEEPVLVNGVFPPCRAVGSLQKDALSPFTLCPPPLRCRRGAERPPPHSTGGGGGGPGTRGGFSLWEGSDLCLVSYCPFLSPADPWGWGRRWEVKAEPPRMIFVPDCTANPARSHMSGN